MRTTSLLAVFILAAAALGAQQTTGAAFPATPADTARSIPVPGAGPVTGTPAPVPAFPRGSAAATTAIPRNLPVVPFVDLSVRSPQTGQEVAFSLQLLLLLTVLSLDRKSVV